MPFTVVFLFAIIFKNALYKLTTVYNKAEGHPGYPEEAQLVRKAWSGLLDRLCQKKAGDS